MRQNFLPKEELFAPLSAAISPCPNDTYIFEAWASKHIPVTLSLDLSFHDVETLNTIALEKASFDLTKLSTACAGKVLDRYVILPVGATFATQTGPFLVGRKKNSLIKKLAIPGKNTSAVQAFTMLYGDSVEMVEYAFHDVPAAVSSGLCDAGILIHEVQSNLAAYTLEVIDDLGTSFRKRFSFCLPLGVILMKRSKGKQCIDTAVLHLEASLLYAKRNERISSFVLERARDPCLAEKHIQTFVTRETQRMGKEEVVHLQAFFSMMHVHTCGGELVHGF